MSKVFRRGNVTPEMNMTPLIDVTFQLIIFFMLVNNIVADQVVEMIPPTLVEPKTRELKEENQLIINVAPADFRFTDRLGKELVHDGKAKFVQIRSLRIPLEEPDRMTEAIKAELEANPGIEVVLRADAAIYYEDVQIVMAAIAAAQVQQVNLVAYMPDKGAIDTASRSGQ
jgi:biopolymer transport protein TolR